MLDAEERIWDLGASWPGAVGRGFIPCEHKSLAGDPGLETGATVLVWDG